MVISLHQSLSPIFENGMRHQIGETLTGEISNDTEKTSMKTQTTVLSVTTLD